MNKARRKKLHARASGVADHDTSDGDWAVLLLEVLDALTEMEADRDEARYTAQLYRERCQILDHYEGLPPLPWETDDE